MRANAPDCLWHQSARVVEQVPKVHLTRQHSELRLATRPKAFRDINAVSHFRMRSALYDYSEPPLTGGFRWGSRASQPRAMRSQDARSMSLLLGHRLGFLGMFFGFVLSGHCTDLGTLTSAMLVVPSVTMSALGQKQTSHCP